MKNNHDLLNINFLYKPNKYTIKGNVMILSCNDRKIVLKEKSNNVLDTHKYLAASGFNNYIPIIDDNRNNYYVYPYIDEENIPIEQKSKDMAKVVGLMHAKTSYQKNIDKSAYENIYTNISDNLSYLKSYYSDLFDKIFLKEYYDPFEVVYMDYYSKIINMINFSNQELEEWYLMVSDKENVRVSLIHNNLEINHFVKSDNDYLLSFDNARKDTPVLDLVSFYKKEYNHISFDEWFKTYNYYSELTDEEKKLFFVLITIPDNFTVEERISNNINNLNNLINYINKTEDLIRPYYSQDKKEEQT